MTSLAEDVRGQIRLALRITNVSQAELGRRLGLSPKHVSQMLTGNAAISLDMAERMLTAVGYTLVVSAREGPAERYRRPAPVPAREEAAGLSVQCTTHGAPVEMIHEGTLWRCPRWMSDDTYAGHVRWVSDADVAEVPAGSSKRLWGTVLISVPARG